MKKEEKARPSRRAGQSKDDKVTCVFLSSRANRHEVARRGTLGEKISIRSAHHSRHRARAHTNHDAPTTSTHRRKEIQETPPPLAAERNGTNERTRRRRGDHQTTVDDDDDDDDDDEMVRLIVRVFARPPSRDETDGRTWSTLKRQRSCESGAVVVRSFVCLFFSGAVSMTDLM